MDRRRFLASGLGVLGAAALGPHPIVRALTLPPATTLSAYGPLLPPNAHGLRLPEGFTSRVIGVTGELVAGTRYAWHSTPDGGAVYGTDDGGWIYVSNCEAPVFGGVGAVRFDSQGTIVDAYRIATGTSLNCAGGPTPWGTWLTCEEHPEGLVWECDPTGVLPPVPLPALGTFQHEAVAIDDLGHAYLTEDVGDGRFYRFTPSSGALASGLDLLEGTLEVAKVDGPGKTGPVEWLPVQAVAVGSSDDVPDQLPQPPTTATRHQQPTSTAFDGGEGAWFHEGHVYWTTKGENRVYDYDTTANTLAVLYDRATSSNPILSGVDNVTVHPQTGSILVAEDGGDMQLCILTRDETDVWAVAPLLQVVGHPGSEITGPAFSPDGTRLYFSSQRGPFSQLPQQPPHPIAPGYTYEVTGPF